MSIWNNISRVAVNPALGLEYANYLCSYYATGGNPTRLMIGDVLLRGFTGFSEYHSCAAAMTKAEYRVLCSLPDAEGPMFDIGANLGLISLLLAKTFPEVNIYSFEPNPLTFNDLCRNILFNNVSNISPSSLALGAAESAMSFVTSFNSRATARIASPNDVDTVNVQCTTVDRYISQSLSSNVISFLKCDTEGHEAAVFQGAESALASGAIRAVYYEVCPVLAERAGYSGDLASEILYGHGYSLYRTSESGVLHAVLPNEARNVDLENWVALPPGRDLNSLRQRG